MNHCYSMLKGMVFLNYFYQFYAIYRKNKSEIIEQKYEIIIYKNSKEMQILCF